MLNPAVRLASSLLLRLAGGRAIRRRVAGAHVQAWTFGPATGEPWVMLHGLASSALAWGPLILHLRRRCRLLVPALSPLGGTRLKDRPEDGLPLATIVAATEALIADQLGGSATVAGTSLGGWAGVRLALEHPERVSRLLLVDPGGYRDQDWVRIGELVRPQSHDDVDRLYRALFTRVTPLLRMIRPAFFRAYTTRAVTSVLEQVTPRDAYGDAELSRLTLPTGLIWGAEDGLFTASVAERMATALPHCWFRLLPDCAHVPHWECPRQLVAAVEAFRRWSAEVTPRSLP